MVYRINTIFAYRVKYNKCTEKVKIWRFEIRGAKLQDNPMPIMVLQTLSGRCKYMTKMVNKIKLMRNESKISSSETSIGVKSAFRNVLAIPLLIAKALYKISFILGFIIGICVYVIIYADNNGLKLFAAISGIFSDKRNILLALALGVTLGLLLLFVSYCLYRMIGAIDGSVMTSIYDNQTTIDVAKRQNEEYKVLAEYGSFDNYEKAEMDKYRKSVNYIDR